MPGKKNFREIGWMVTIQWQAYIGSIVVTIKSQLQLMILSFSESLAFIIDSISLLIILLAS